MSEILVKLKNLFYFTYLLVRIEIFRNRELEERNKYLFFKICFEIALILNWLKEKRALMCASIFVLIAIAAYFMYRPPVQQKVELDLATVHFEEQFAEYADNKRWVDSTYYGAEQGKFTLVSQPEFNSHGLQTTSSHDYSFYAISARFVEPFSNEDKSLVVQFSVKQEDAMGCGEAYVKLLPKEVEQTSFNKRSPFYVMFGPNICDSVKTIHVVLSYNNQELFIKKRIGKRIIEDDQLTHLYTLVVNPNNTYVVKIDNQEVESGNLLDDVWPSVDLAADPNSVRLYRYNDIGAIGFDLHQKKSGTIFGNILVTDDEKYAEKVARETWGSREKRELSGE